MIIGGWFWGGRWFWGFWGRLWFWLVSFIKWTSWHTWWWVHWILKDGWDDNNTRFISVRSMVPLPSTSYLTVQEIKIIILIRRSSSKLSYIYQGMGRFCCNIWMPWEGLHAECQTELLFRRSLRGHMEGQHELSAQKNNSIIFKDLAVAPEINCSIFVSVKRSEDVLGKGLCISAEKG